MIYTLLAGGPSSHTCGRDSVESSILTQHGHVSHSTDIAYCTSTRLISVSLLAGVCVCCPSKTAISAAVAMFTAFCKDKSDSASNFFCVSPFCKPHTKRSRKASSRNAPKSQVWARRHIWITNLFTDSPESWSCL